MKLRPLTIGLVGAALILVALAAACGDDDSGGDARENAGTAVIGDTTYDFDVTGCGNSVDTSEPGAAFTIEGKGTTSDGKPILVNISRSSNGDTFAIIGINQASLIVQPERQFSMVVAPGNATVEVGPEVLSLRITGTVIEVQHERLPEFPVEIDLTCQV